MRGDMAKLELRWAVGLFLGRTDESDEAIVGAAAGIKFVRSFRRRTKDKQWERDAFTTFIGVPRNPKGLVVEAPMASSRRRYITKSLIQQHGETPGCSACSGIASQHTAKCRERFEKLINPNATDPIPGGPTITEDDQQPAGSAAPAEQQQQAAQLGTSPCSPLQARREPWRTVQRHRQRRELTRDLALCLRSRRSHTSR